MTAPKSWWIWCSNEFIVQTIQCLEFILIIVLKVKNGWNKFKVRNKDIRTSLFSQCWFFVIDDFKHIVIWLVLSSIFYILTTISQLAIKMQNIFFRSSCLELNCKKGLLSNFVNVTKNTCLGVSFKESCRPILATWLCKELDDGVFQWILRTLFQDSYCITPLEGYFCFMDLFLIMMVWTFNLYIFSTVILVTWFF